MSQISINKINLDERVFRAVSNSDNGEVSGETRFYYKQKDNVVTARYVGGEVRSGHLIALIDDEGQLNMRYHHVNTSGEIMLGQCRSTPELLSDGRLRFHESWQWLCDDKSEGTSIIEEVFHS